MNRTYTLTRYHSILLSKLVVLLWLLGSWQLTTAQTIAFPGAEGAGRFATGGRGTATQPTQVFEVTSLGDDNTPGTLRYAVSASQTTYPHRTIVFRVAGTIHLTAKLNIRSNTTIAGQTAPGGGICIADHPVVISGDNVILRYVRIRMGDRYQDKGKVDGSGGDDVLGNLGNKNIIIDHCSISWSSDECLTIYRGDSVTIQWSIVSEPLNYSYHFEAGGTDYQEHGYGGIWGSKRGSFHHNLIAHVKGRAPRFAGSSTYAPATAGTENADFRNNVIYNWISYSTNGGDGGNYNVVNNYYKYGPSTSTGNSAGIPIRYMIMNPSKSDLPYPKVYLSGNYVDGSTDITSNNWKGIAMSGSSLADTGLSKVLQPFDIAPLNMHSATDAYQLVLQKAGALLPERDTLDQRIINDVKNRTGRVIDVQGGFPHGTPYAQTVNAWPNLAAGTPLADDDHDGMPNVWELARGLNPNDAADRATVNAVGYTNLEVYLNAIEPATAKADLVVAKDGSGHYTSLQAAIDAAPTGRTTPFIIYIKNGIYKEKINIPSNKPFIHLIGESVGNTIVTWDDYSGKVVGGTTIGTSTSATITISAADCLAADITFENATGYTGDGPQALAINVSGDRCAFKNCRFIGGQDTVLANGTGKRQYFRNCYIDGNTDFIFGSAIAVFDSCVIHPRDRVDGGSGGYVTAANTPQGQAYGYVFRDCRLTKNRGVTNYTLGRPWQNDASSTDASRAHNKTVFINSVMSASIRGEGWSAWDANTNTSVITYAEYKTKKWDGTLVSTGQRVSWSKQLTDAEAASYTLSSIFGSWDPCATLAGICSPQAVQLAVSNMRVQRGASQSTLSWNLSWPVADVKYDLYRSTDSIQFSKINEIMGGVDSVVAFSVTDALPQTGVTYYYFVQASRAGMESHKSHIVSVNTLKPLNGEFRSAASGHWTNAASGNGSNAASVWEKYTAATDTWELQPLGTAPNAVNVTIRAGHTVILDGLKNVNNLTIEAGGVLKGNGAYGGSPAPQALRVGAGAGAGVVIRNDGLLGGDASPDDLIILEFTANCASVLVTGSGVTKITRLRPLYPNSNPLTVTFDQDMSLSYNSGGFTAYYNNAANTTSENFTYIINAGKTIRITNAAGSFNATPNPTPNPGGRYTYLINGTLDLSATTATSHAVPFSANANSLVAIRVGSTGLLKLGTGFNTVNSAPGAANGKVELSIANGGMVDATKTTNFNLGTNYFITEGSGALRRAVAATPVVFPLGTAAGTPNPVSIANTGTADNFTVRVKASIDQAPPAPLHTLGTQWNITEETPGGSIVELRLGWLTSTQPTAFDATKPVYALRYNGATWKQTAATLAGAGTEADPVYATAAGITEFNNFIVSNYYSTLAATGSLTAFAQTHGTPSAAQTYTLKGTSLTGDIRITPTTGYEVSANTTNWFNSTTPLVIAPVNGAVNATVSVRLNAVSAASYTGNLVHSSTGALPVTVAITGTTVGAPAITQSGSIVGFSQTLGAPSAPQTITLAGQNLIGKLSIAAPVHYEISVDGVTWAGKDKTLEFTPASGAVTARDIQVRLHASVTGPHDGAVIIASSGHAEVPVLLSGNTMPAFSITPNPAHDWLVVYHPRRYTIGKLYIYNTNGRPMGNYYTRTSANSTTINISALPAGVYYIEHRVQNELSTMKFIKL
ncbi:pectinesterase family protein [Paraflavitalea sp. CAU 1676]|uniref:pectinesterase family protein n=1 Tax=Paraflavitalea sp. CAU 1676 TaxID=3032598 RepID=UPI0023DBA2DA|nr:pectinesterase family protein [Paraflavitalea sp. CAU 1676]MDF2189560.1 pectinesterase family protein [Paraflavitalea sp. CAU 1676]